ncbi:hypothetical protein [Flavobacterium terrisoli]|nr:hypothetical protein [Flavobacterium buctense]
MSNKQSTWIITGIVLRSPLVIIMPEKMLLMPNKKSTNTSLTKKNRTINP